MKNNTYKFIYLIIILIISYQILTHSSIVFSSVEYAINIWKNSLLPSMFTFFILSEILVNYGFVELIGYILYKPFNYIFHINSNSIFVIIMSMLTGFPSSAKYIKLLLSENKITEEEANKLIQFTHFSNPLFIINTISLTILNDSKIGLLVLISHYLGNFIIALFIRPKHIENKQPKLQLTIKDSNIVRVLTKAITNSIDTLLLVLGIITTCTILSNIVSVHISEEFSFLFNIIFEMTKGLYQIKDIDLTLLYKGLLSVMIISFGGISVHMQVSSILSDTKIKYVPFFIARIIHSLISSLIFFIMFMMH